MLLSIVIPVYRVERTLEVCVVSVLGQSFPDYELILVDDGSPDRCPVMCDGYARKDGRVKVVHQQNGGLSAARNAGVAVAIGDYLMFIDSDDHIGGDTLQQLADVLKAHPEYDLLEFPVTVHFGHASRQRLMCPSGSSYVDMGRYWLGEQAFRHSYACNKVFRRSLFSKVLFPVGRKFEDVHVLPLLLEQCRVVGTTGVGMYCYHDNPQGITATADGEALQDLLDAHRVVLGNHGLRCMQTCGDRRLEKALADYHAHVLNIVLDVYEHTGRMEDIPGFKCNYQLKPILYKLLGITVLCKLNKWMHRHYRRNR